MNQTAAARTTSKIRQALQSFVNLRRTIQPPKKLPLSSHAVNQRQMETLLPLHSDFPVVYRLQTPPSAPTRKEMIAARGAVHGQPNVLSRTTGHPCKAL